MENTREIIAHMIDNIMDDVDDWRNKCAEKYYNALLENGIDIDTDTITNLFYELMDGFDDTDEAVDIIMGNKTLEEVMEKYN